MTPPRRMVMRHLWGRGAEAMFRGAEPLCGKAAQRRKRAIRGYMLLFARVEHGLPLRQRMFPLVQEQNMRFPALQRQSGVKARVYRMNNGGSFHAVADIDDVESRVNEPVAFLLQCPGAHGDNDGIGFQFL